MSIQKEPLVSVVVPVRNAENYLRDCLDSLVYQTLEDIEIIVVENGFVDDTAAIAGEYVERFPGKVFYYSISPATFFAKSRSFGFKKASAEYVYSCDGDTLVSLNALEVLYNKAVEGDYDIVGGRHFSYTDGLRTVSKRLPEDLTTAQYIMLQQPTFSSELIKRSLIQKQGDIFDSPFSDLSYLLPLNSYAEKVAYVNSPPLYHSFVRSGSETSVFSAKERFDGITAQKIALSQANPAYRDAVLYYIAKTAASDFTQRWFLIDTLVSWLKELWPELEGNPYLLQDQKLFDCLSAYAALPEGPAPCIVYVNGFHQDHEAKEVFSNSKVTPFWDLEKVEELNEKTCDVNEHPVIAHAYEAGNYEFVAQYFAIKRIYETGGIYLHKNIVIDVPFNYTRYWRSFFGFVDDKTYSDWVFGGQKGSAVLAALLRSYDYIYDNNEFYPLSERIGIVLLTEFDMPATGKTNLTNMQVCCTLGPEVVFCQNQGTDEARSAVHLCRHVQYSYPPDVEIYTLSAETIKTVIYNGAANTPYCRAINAKARTYRKRNQALKDENGTLRERNRALKDENGTLRKSNQALKNVNGALKVKNQSLKTQNNKLKEANNKKILRIKKEFNKTKRGLDKAKTELREIKSSRTWRLLQRLQDFGNSPIGRPLKKLLRFLKIL